MEKSKKIIKYVAILCAGVAKRSQLGYNKALFCLNDKPIIETVLEKFSHFDRILLVANKADFEQIKQIGLPFNAEIIEGGMTRSESAKLAVFHLFNTTEASEIEHTIVAIHDSARPFVSKNLIEKTVSSAMKFGSGVPAVKVVDSLKRAYESIVTEAVERENLYSMQTPQTFKLNEIFTAYSQIDREFSDDGEVYRNAGYDLKLVEGEYTNKKLTVAEDFYLNSQNGQNPFNFCSVGVGFDVHPLVKKRKLILGGIEIEYKKGLLGISDADVLIHAISDAILSASKQRDIGNLFPENDSKNIGLNSEIILKTAHEKLTQSNQKIAFISAVIIAQKPKLSPYIPKIIENLSNILQIDQKSINISATTTEFLGIIGRSKAIAVAVNCLCVSN